MSGGDEDSLRVRDWRDLGGRKFWLPRGGGVGLFYSRGCEGPRFTVLDTNYAPLRRIYQQLDT